MQQQRGAYNLALTSRELNEDPIAKCTRFMHSLDKTHAKFRECLLNSQLGLNEAKVNAYCGESYSDAWNKLKGAYLASEKTALRKDEIQKITQSRVKETQQATSIAVDDLQVAPRLAQQQTHKERLKQRILDAKLAGLDEQLDLLYRQAEDLGSYQLRERNMINARKELQERNIGQLKDFGKNRTAKQQTLGLRSVSEVDLHKTRVDATRFKNL